MLIHWKKKEKEITELRKKRDRAEKDISKKEEEQREAILNKKKFEYIMRQSELFVGFMA